jgi:hypothetical protein
MPIAELGLQGERTEAAMAITPLRPSCAQIAVARPYA